MKYIMQNDSAILIDYDDTDWQQLDVTNIEHGLLFPAYHEEEQKEENND